MSEGGDPACWADRVCPACGMLDERERRDARCPHCGATDGEPDGATAPGPAADRPGAGSTRAGDSSGGDAAR